jgi:hypothetical protein
MAALATSELFGVLNGSNEEPGIYGTLFAIHRVVWLVVLFRWWNYEIGI